MDSVIGIHEIVLKPNIQAKDFERFIRDQRYSLPTIPGVRIRFLRRGHGTHGGTYIMLVEIARSTEGTWGFPVPIGNARELEHWLMRHAPNWTTFGTMAEACWADYVEIGA